MRVRFACGHVTEISDGTTARPVCRCGEFRITRTFAPPPRFRGYCSGPHTEFVRLDPFAALLVPRPAEVAPAVTPDVHLNDPPVKPPIVVTKARSGRQSVRMKATPKKKGRRA